MPWNISVEHGAYMPNRAQCLHCGDIIESKCTYDFVTCSCWNEEQKKDIPEHGIFLDGGNSYYRYGYANLSELKTLFENENV